MGNGGTGDRALGLASVTLLARAIAASLSVLALAGCTLTGNLVAAAAGGATGAATANPAVGIAVGVAVNSAIDATFAYAGRKLQQSEQDALASEVGTMQVGERRPWRIDHFIPIGNEHGEVVITRDIVTPLTTCKELVFSVQSGSGTDTKSDWYDTQACQDGAQWKWALAEPAAGRWEVLQ
jgi:hypothetical protein